MWQMRKSKKGFTYLEIAELGELLAAVVKAADERLGGRVHNHVGAHVAALGKALAAQGALVRTLAGVATLVGLHMRQKARNHAYEPGMYLEVAELGETLATVWLIAKLDGLSAIIHSEYNVERLTKGLMPVCALV
jgi:hypothetical protein